MKATPLDRYFELLDSGGENSAELGELGDLFAEDADFWYGGEVARTRTWIVHLHQSLLRRRTRSAHTWTTKTEGADLLTADWSEAGVDARGNEFIANGRAHAVLDDSGRITRLRLSFDGGTDRARVYIGRHLEAWALPDLDKRIEKIKETYAEDIRFLEMEEVLLGHQEISDRIGKVLELAPPILIQIEGVIENHDYIQWEWSFVHPSGGTARGWEVLHINGDVIDSLVVFTPDMATVVDGVR
jgi:hypothetical protein